MLNLFLTLKTKQMKNLPIVIVCFLFFSCSKSEFVKKDQGQEIKETAIKQVLNVDEEQLQKNMFNSLNS